VPTLEHAARIRPERTNACGPATIGQRSARLRWMGVVMMDAERTTWRLLRNAAAAFGARTRTDPQQRLLVLSFSGLAIVLIAIGVTVAFTLQHRIEQRTEAVAGTIMTNAVRGHLDHRTIDGQQVTIGPPPSDTIWWQRFRAQLKTMIEAQDVDVLDSNGVIQLGDQPDEVGQRFIPPRKLSRLEADDSVEFLRTTPSGSPRQVFVVVTPITFVTSKGEPAGTGAVSLEFDAGPLLSAARDARNMALGTTAGVLALLLVTLWILARRLTQRTFRDNLTNLPNRRYFTEAATTALAHNDRHQRPTALIYADINRFGEVNATLGHRAGDAVLQSVARALHRRARAGDTLARIGGDDFALLLNEATPEDARLAADHITTTLETATALDQQRLRISLSMGIACHPQHGHGIDELLQHAETAMREAKARQLPYVHFDPTDPRTTSEHLSLEADLRDAILNDDLDIHYQPIVTSRDTTTVAYEALARWSHASGPISPGTFIPIAERTGLIRHLDRAIYKGAVLAMATLQTHRPDARIAINLSAPSLADATLTAYLRDVAERHGVSPTRITLEVTESASLEDLERAATTLRTIRDLGFRISLDDFGTGYSSLAYLRTLPIDTVKIDRHFIHGIGRRTSDETLVQAIARYAHSLHIRTVAEGVETEAQHHWLQQQGIDYEQGYLHGKPAPLPQGDTSKPLRQPAPLARRHPETPRWPAREP